MGTYRLTLNSNRLAIILEPSNNDCDHKSLIISHQALTSSVRHWVAGFPSHGTRGPKVPKTFQAGPTQPGRCLAARGNH